MEKVEDQIKKADEKLIEIRSAKKELEQERALKDAPVNENRSADRAKFYADVQKAMKESRAVTVSGTDTVNVASNLVYALEAKKDLLKRFSIFTGASASNIIPVWNNGEGEFSPVAENGTFATADGAMSTTTIQPYAFAKSIKVSDEVLKLSAVNFESEINTIITNSMARTILKQIFNGTGADGQFTPITSGATAMTVTAFNMTNLQKFALEIMDKTDNGVILMNPSVYSTLVDGSTKKEEVLIKKLLEDKTIEGVPVVLSSYVPDATGGNYCIGGDLNNYAIGVANELQITPKQTAGTLAHTYDASVYINGKPIVAGEFEVLKVSA